MLYFNILACIKSLKGSVLTNSSSGIQHAWHFWYALVSVLKCNAEAWSLRASPLNWALVPQRKQSIHRKFLFLVKHAHDSDNVAFDPI